MSVTLRDLVDESELGLIAHAEPGALRRPMSWVHTSELRDPTPFLEGGELLLTTGLGLVAEDEVCRAYVDRLVTAGVSALGFGVEISHQGMPEPLARAAVEAGLPLLEVPRQVPFIAISKSVSRALAAEEYAELRRISRAQRELARAASGSGGLSALIDRLAKLLQGWVLLLDSAGAVLRASPQSAVHRHADLRAEVARLRGKKGIAASSVSLDDAEVSLQVLGTRARGVLAVGRAEPWATTDHHVINSAASLLTLALEQQHEVGDARRRLRAGTFELLLREGGDLARRPLRELLADLPTGALRVLCVSGSRGVEAILDLLETETSGLADTPFTAEYDDRVVALAAEGGQAVDRLTTLARRYEGLRVGVSEPCTLDGVDEGYRQASDAARHATAGAVFFSELAGHGLLRLVPTEDARAFAESLLAPLRDHDATAHASRGGGLEESVREWLAQHGQWDPAASRLGVHRHTLRNRVRKAEQLLGRSLDDPGLRAELWMALRVLDQEA